MQCSIGQVLLAGITFVIALGTSLVQGCPHTEAHASQLYTGNAKYQRTKELRVE